MNLRICIVTFELQDIAPTGGIGTATQHLALHLKKLGHAVDVFFTDRGKVSPDKIGYWQKHYAVTYHIPFKVPSVILSTKVNCYGARHGHDLLEHLAESIPYDIILFHEMGADGFFCLKNKSSLPFLQNTAIGVITHSPAQWVWERNAQPITDLLKAQASDLERACVEMADFVLSPSQYLVDWMRCHGWELPKQTHIIPYLLLPESGSWEAHTKTTFPRDINEIVFFGRLDARKGIYEFLDALCLLPPSLLQSKKITLLGEFGVIDHLLFAEKWQRVQSLCARTLHVLGKDARGAREYLQSHSCVAVLPSLGDNSPCVVYECMIDGIPFLSSNMGGQSELIDPAFHELCLFTPRATLMSQKVTQFFSQDEVAIPTPSKAVLEALVRTDQLLVAEAAKAKARSVTAAASFPAVDVVLACQCDGEAEEAILSILQQDYPAFRLTIMSARPLPEAMQRIVNSHENLRFIQAKAYTVGMLYNAALSHITHDYSVFMDSSITLDQNYMKACATHAMRGCYDAVVTAIKDDIHDDVYLSLGGGCPGSFYAFSAVRNSLGGGAVWVKTDVARQVRFPEAYRARHEDWGFLLDLQLRGNTIAALTDVLQHCKGCPAAFRLEDNAVRNFKSRGIVLCKHRRFTERDLSELCCFKRIGNRAVTKFYEHLPNNVLLRWLAEKMPKIYSRIYAKYQANKLRQAKAFDDAWYYAKYPDVQKAGMNALEHYLLYGWKEGRNPSDQFNTFAYLNRNRDVHLSGVNPFVHYVFFGKKEGRRADI